MRSYPIVPLSVSSAAKKRVGVKDDQILNVLRMEFSIMENVPTPRESIFKLFNVFQRQSGEKLKKCSKSCIRITDFQYFPLYLYVSWSYPLGALGTTSTVLHPVK